MQLISLLAYTGYPDLYFCMSLEQSWVDHGLAYVSPRTNLDKQANNKQEEEEERPVHTGMWWKSEEDPCLMWTHYFSLD